RDRNVTGVQTCALPILILGAAFQKSSHLITTLNRPMSGKSSVLHHRRNRGLPICPGIYSLWTKLTTSRPLRSVRRATFRGRWGRSEERRVGKEGRSGGG